MQCDWLVIDETGRRLPWCTAKGRELHSTKFCTEADCGMYRTGQEEEKLAGVGLFTAQRIAGPAERRDEEDEPEPGRVKNSRSRRETPERGDHKEKISEMALGIKWDESAEKTVAGAGDAPLWQWARDEMARRIATGEPKMTARLAVAHECGCQGKSTAGMEAVIKGRECKERGEPMPWAKNAGAAPNPRRRDAASHRIAPPTPFPTGARDDGNGDGVETPDGDAEHGRGKVQENLNGLVADVHCTMASTVVDVAAGMADVGAVKLGMALELVIVRQWLSTTGQEQRYNDFKAGFSAALNLNGAQ